MTDIDTDDLDPADPADLAELVRRARAALSEIPPHPQTDTLAQILDVIGDRVSAQDEHDEHVRLAIADTVAILMRK